MVESGEITETEEMSGMKHGKNLIVLAIAVAVGFALLTAYIQPRLNYIPPGDPPVNPPPIGTFDYVSHQVNRTISATDQLVDIDDSLFYESFSADSDGVCLYGNFTTDRPVAFMITDQQGLEEYLDDGSPSRYHTLISGVHSHEWEVTLGDTLQGDDVDQWYVVISAFGYYFWEYDRHVSYYICEDLSPPTVEMNVPALLNGSITFYPRVTDLHCDISVLRVYANGSEVFRETPNQREYSTSFIWDSTPLDNGPCRIEVLVEDEVGNSWIYRWWSEISNPTPGEVAQISVHQLISVVGFASGLTVVVIVILFKPKGAKVLALLAILVAISTISTQATVGAAPDEWTIWEWLEVIANILGVIGFIWQLLGAVKKWRKSRSGGLEGDPPYIG